LRALETALPVVRDGRSVGFLFLPNGEDPDTWVRKAGPTAFTDPAAVKTLSTFLFESLCAQVDLQSLDGRARLVELAKPLLRQVPEGALRTLLFQRLSELSRIGAGELERQAGASGASQGVQPAELRTRASPAPSLVRSAITLLLHQPGLARGAGDIASIRAATAPGAALLADLIELLQERPDTSSGALLEHWRGTETATHLSKLLREPLGVSLPGAALEFQTALEKIRQRSEKSLLDQMVNRVKPSEYTVAEKATLRAAIAARKPVPKD
jgi:DNA primase